MIINLYTVDNKFIKETNMFTYNFTGKLKWPNGETSWRLNGKFHRIGGPAYIWHNGDEEWWIDNKIVTKEEHDLLYDIMKLKGLI